MFLSYFACNELLPMLAYRIFLNIQWQRENIQPLIYILKSIVLNQNQCNTVNKKCSLDLDVAYF